MPCRHCSYVDESAAKGPQSGQYEFVTTAKSGFELVGTLRPDKRLRGGDGDGDGEEEDVDDDDDDDELVLSVSTKLDASNRNLMSSRMELYNFLMAPGELYIEHALRNKGLSKL